MLKKSSSLLMLIGLALLGACLPSSKIRTPTLIQKSRLFQDSPFIPNSNPSNTWNLLFEESFENNGSPLTYFAHNWGTQIDPVNFARDSSVAKTGNASFKIHKPANTNAYAVTQHLSIYTIKPNDKAKYRVSFWAKSDQERTSQFFFVSYESVIDPAIPGSAFKDAPPLPPFSIQVGSDWRFFSFEIQDRFDFFSTTSKFILPSFKASNTLSEESTLWIDDVKVEWQLPPQIQDSIDPHTLTPLIPPAPFSPSSGNQISLNLSPQTELGFTPKSLGGISIHRPAGWINKPFDTNGTYTQTLQEDQWIRDLALPTSRVYNLMPDNFQSFSIEQAIDKVAYWASRNQVPAQEIALELEDQGSNSTLSPTGWENVVQYAATHTDFRIWEIGNETYGAQHFSSDFGAAFPDAESYAAHFIAVSRAIRAVQPWAKIGISIHKTDPRWQSWLLSRTRGEYDFVVPHLYAWSDLDQDTLEETIISRSREEVATAHRIKALASAYNSTLGKSASIRDTEWALAASHSNTTIETEIMNSNIVGSLHSLFRLIQYAREEALEAASAWQLYANPAYPGFGFIQTGQSSSQKILKYFVHKLFNTHLGSKKIQLAGLTPHFFSRVSQSQESLVDGIATIEPATGEIYIILANGSSDRDFPLQICLNSKNFSTILKTEFSHFVSDPAHHTGVTQSDNEAIRSTQLTANSNCYSDTLNSKSALFLKITLSQ